MPKNNSDETEKMKGLIPVGKCMDMDTGEENGMLVCRTGEDDFAALSKDGKIKDVKFKLKDL